jgi:hypothetical protein
MIIVCVDVFELTVFFEDVWNLPTPLSPPVVDAEERS